MWKFICGDINTDLQEDGRCCVSVRILGKNAMRKNFGNARKKYRNFVRFRDILFTLISLGSTFISPIVYIIWVSRIWNFWVADFLKLS
jgi:hypothetical protein